MARRKFYVVWAGHETGIYDNWDDALLQVENFPGARYKSFDSQTEAVEAYRGNPDDYLKVFRSMASREPQVVNYAAIPEIAPGSIAVDAACSGNPGPVEYQCVDINTGTRIFHVGPLPGGTNNIGEFLALVHALALLEKQGRPNVTIYTDSRTALAWVRNRHAKTAITPNARNAKIMDMLHRAEAWLQTHRPVNPIQKWNTEKWGEIPADFGRK